MTMRVRWRIVAAAVAMALQTTRVLAGDWLQFGYDSAHSGWNPVEQGYSTAAGNRQAFAPVALPLAVDVAPVFLAAVPTAHGPMDLLFIVSKNGTAIALNAADGAVVWSHKPGGVGTLTTSSPALDPDRTRVYAYGLDGAVHAYAVADGSEVKADGWPQRVTLKPEVDKVASALTVAIAGDGIARLYAATNSYYDAGDFQGSVTTIDLPTGSQRVFNAQCSALSMHFVKNGFTSGDNQNDCKSIASSIAGETANSGIWGRPGATYDRTTDRIYVATGNGRFDPNDDLGDGNDWGDSVLALPPDGSGSGAGQPLDSYTPIDDASLLQNDADLGSTSPAIVPAPAPSTLAHLAVQGGKDGCVRLLNLDDLSGAASPGHVGGELQAIPLPGTADHCGDGTNVNNFLTQPAVWINPADGMTWIVIAHGGGIAALRIELDESDKPQLVPQWSTAGAGTSPVIANGTVYYVGNNVLRALDIATGMQVWSATGLAKVHWQSPIIVNGRIYVIDQGAKLWVFALDGVFRQSFD